MSKQISKSLSPDHPTTNIKREERRSFKRQEM